MQILLWIGRLSGAVGVLLTVASVAARLTGRYQLGTFQSLTLLDAGTAGMVMACLAYIAAMAEHRR
jgi:hypothetical protein